MRTANDKEPTGWWIGLMRDIEGRNEVSLVIQVVTPWRTVQRYDFNRRKVLAKRKYWLRITLFPFVMVRGGYPLFEGRDHGTQRR